MIKELHKEGNLVMGILDDNNYVIYDSSKPKKGKDRNGNETMRYDYKYFSQMEHCVKRLAQLVANGKAKDLHGWLEEYRAITERCMA